MNPHNGNLPYVYDYYKWPQCEEEGYPLDLLGDSTADDDGNAWDSRR